MGAYITIIPTTDIEANRIMTDRITIVYYNL